MWESEGPSARIPGLLPPLRSTVQESGDSDQEGLFEQQGQEVMGWQGTAQEDSLKESSVQHQSWYGTRGRAGWGRGQGSMAPALRPQSHQRSQSVVISRWNRLTATGTLQCGFEKGFLLQPPWGPLQPGGGDTLPASVEQQRRWGSYCVPSTALQSGAPAGNKPRDRKPDVMQPISPSSFAQS